MRVLKENQPEEASQMMIGSDSPQQKAEKKSLFGRFRKRHSASKKTSAQHKVPDTINENKPVEVASTIKEEKENQAQPDAPSVNSGRILSKAASKTYDEIKGMELLMISEGGKKTHSSTAHEDMSQVSSASSTKNISQGREDSRAELREDIVESKSSVEYDLREGATMERKPSLLVKVASRLPFKALSLKRSNTEDTLDSLTVQGDVSETLKDDTPDYIPTASSKLSRTRNEAEDAKIASLYRRDGAMRLARDHALADDDSDIDENGSQVTTLVRDDLSTSSSFVSQVPYFEPLLDPFRVGQYDKCLGY